jgi:hypothetical protein
MVLMAGRRELWAECTGDLLSGTPRPGAEVGPPCTPVTDDVSQVFPGRAAQAFTGGVPTFNMEVDEVELHPQGPRAQHSDQVSQASSSDAAGIASPPGGAALQWQPTTTLVPLHMALMVPVDRCGSTRRT